MARGNSKAQSEVTGQIPPLGGGLPDNYGVTRGVVIGMANDVNAIAVKTKRNPPRVAKANLKSILEDDDETYENRLQTTKFIPFKGPGSDLDKVAMMLARVGRFKEQNKDSWDRQIDEKTKDMVLDALHVADTAWVNAGGLIRDVEATGRQNEPRVKARLDELREIYEENKNARQTIVRLEQQRALENVSRFLGG
jgi:thymidylate synthase